jgi:hypothetical protein
MVMATFTKGHAKLGGRRKGVLNKITVAAKQAVMLAFAELGGVAGLVAYAKMKKPPQGLVEFYRLWGKTIPPEVSGPEGRPIPFADMTDDAIRGEISRIRAALDASRSRGDGQGAGQPGARPVKITEK